MNRSDTYRGRPATNGTPSRSIATDSRTVLREIAVTLDPNRGWAEVSPYKARGLCRSVGAKRIWLGARKVWSVNYGHGIDVIALAEHLRIVVVLLSGPSQEADRLPTSSHDTSAEAGGLW